jgi:hypothetical protein
MSRHIAYLTNENLVSLVARGGRIAERKVFPVSGAGHEDFERHLKALGAVPTHLVTDLVEEDFRVDTIPHVGSRDREAVLARRLAQIFRSTAYRHAIVQGREPEGRKDDRVVYTAITNGEVLRPWLEVFERLQVPFEGIHSCAIFSGRLLAELKLEFPHTLLVTFTPGDALRQTYFRNREIKFSRLTPIALEEGETLGGLVAGETSRTWQYLDSLRYFGAEERLEVCVLIHPKDRATVERALKDYDRIQHRLLDIEQVAARLGIKPPPMSSSAEEVLAHLFLKRPAENHYAPPELRRFAVLRSARIAIASVAGAVLASGFAYAGWNLTFAMQSRDRDLQTMRQIQAAQRELDEITRSMPAQGVGGQTMRDAVAFYAGSLREYPTVAGMLLPVSAVLERHPGIRLTQVAWQAADDEKTMPTIVPTVPREPPPVKALARGAGPEGAAAPAGRPAPEPADAAFASGRHSVALLEAVVTVDGTDFRTAIAEVRGFIEGIGAIPGYRADLVDSPLDITPRVAIQGQLGERVPAKSQARFTVRVSRKAGPRA